MVLELDVMKWLEQESAVLELERDLAVGLHQRDTYYRLVDMTL